MKMYQGEINNKTSRSRWNWRLLLSILVVASFWYAVVLIVAKIIL